MLLMHEMESISPTSFLIALSGVNTRKRLSHPSSPTHGTNKISLPDHYARFQLNLNWTLLNCFTLSCDD